MPETAVAGPDVDSEVVLPVPDRSRRQRLLVATFLSVASAVVATMLGIVLRRRGAAAGSSAPAASRLAPTSTINVNWGFALFGTNVMAEGGRRPAWLRRGLHRRR